MDPLTPIHVDEKPFPQDYPVTVAVFGFCRTLRRQWF